MVFSSARATFDQGLTTNVPVGTGGAGTHSPGELMAWVVGLGAAGAWAIVG